MSSFTHTMALTTCGCNFAEGGGSKQSSTKFRTTPTLAPLEPYRIPGDIAKRQAKTEILPEQPRGGMWSPSSFESTSSFPSETEGGRVLGGRLASSLSPLDLVGSSDACDCRAASTRA